MASDRHLAEAYRRLAWNARGLYEARQRKVFVDLAGHEPPTTKYPDPTIPVRPPLRGPKGFGVSEVAARYWLEHCALLSGRMDDFDHETRRGYTIACKLLGMSWTHTQWAIGGAKTSGVQRAAEVWAPYMNSPDPRYVGHVYVARREDGVGPIKVGFTTNIKKRMKRLSSQQRHPIEAIAVHPGTMLIEWALHMELGATAGAPEWYLPEQIPEWLCPTLGRRAA